MSPSFSQLTPELMVESVIQTLPFYTDILGFKTVMAAPEKDPFFVILANGPVEVMLYQREQFAAEIPQFDEMKLGGTVALYISVKDISVFYTKVKDKVKIIQPLHTTDYGSVEFSISDPNGYVLMFNERT